MTDVKTVRSTIRADPKKGNARSEGLPPQGRRSDPAVSEDRVTRNAPDAQQSGASAGDDVRPEDEFLTD